MGIFSNFKINSLKKKIENRYESRMEELVLGLKDLPEDQRKEISNRCRFALRATEFAKRMIHFLFYPNIGVFRSDADIGIFRGDIGNLDEYNLDRLYQMMAIWYSWAMIRADSTGKKNQEGISLCINSLETCLGISPPVTKNYYDGLASIEARLLPFALYRWCMLAVGHADIYYETMHENSPDCQKFIVITHGAFSGVEESFNNPL